MNIHFKVSDKIDWYRFSQNQNAVPVLEKNMELIEWSPFSNNCYAIHLLKQNPEKINITWFCEYQPIKYQPILQVLTDKKIPCWYGLSANPDAIPLLENRLDNISWYSQIWQRFIY